MAPEKKILLSVLLLAIAQQDARNIHHYDNRRESQALIQKDAWLFVRSEEFVLMAQAIGFDPHFLREMGPDVAMAAFELLTSDKRESTNEFD